MRTTLTIDPDVAERLRQETANGKRSLKQVVNERLRMGFGIHPKPSRQAFKVRPLDSRYCPGVDRAKLNLLAGDLEMEAFAKRPR